MRTNNTRREAPTYFLLGFLLWVLIDLGTAGGFRLSYFPAHGPLLLAFYVGYPLLFTYLIFWRAWQGRRLFVATLAAIMVVEGLFTRNPFVLSFPLMLVGIPLAVCIYAPLTYFPLWIVRGEVWAHKGVVLGTSGVVVVVMLLTALSRR